MVNELPFNIANLEAIDLKSLTARDPTATQKLLKAAQSCGFFYLGLQNEPLGQELISLLPDIYTLSDRYFDQPNEEKVKDRRTLQGASQDRGYKWSACDETFEIAYDEVIGGAMQFSGILQEQTGLIDRFSRLCHSACLTVLSSLSDALKIHEDKRFELSHRAGETSDSGLKLISEPSLAKLSDVGDNQHTDSGTLTMLFYDKWGLHIKSPKGGDWAFTSPIPGYALINIADSLQRLSESKLHSPRHRVTQPRDGYAKRYYISYFLRPEHAVKEMWCQ